MNMANCIYKSIRIRGSVVFLGTIASGVIAKRKATDQKARIKMAETGAMVPSMNFIDGLHPMHFTSGKPNPVINVK